MKIDGIDVSEGKRWRDFAEATARRDLPAEQHDAAMAGYDTRLMMRARGCTAARCNQGDFKRCCKQ